MAGSRVMGRPSTSASGPRTHMGHLRSWPRASGCCVTPGSFSPPSCDTNIVGCHVPGVTVRSQKPVCVKRWNQAPRKCSGNVASLRWTARACTPGPRCTRYGVGVHPGLPQEQTPHRPTRPPGRLGQHRGGSSRGHGALLPIAGQQRPWPPPSRRQALPRHSGQGAEPRPPSAPWARPWGPVVPSGCVICSLGQEARCWTTAPRATLRGPSDARYTLLLAVLAGPLFPSRRHEGLGPRCPQLLHTSSTQ